MNKLKKGFTIAELLLCIAIIGVVSAMGMTLTKYNVETNLSTNGTLDAKANAVNARENIGTSTIYYDLADGYYYYVNRPIRIIFV